MKRSNRQKVGYALLLSGLLWSGTAQAQQPVSVKVEFVARTEAKEKVAPDPAKLSDLVRIKADADSSAGVTKVLFEVDDQLRLDVKKPPYVFEWDTLNENDGQHTLSVIAYNVNGQTGVKRIKVTLANQLNLGIGHYAAEALQAFRRGDEPGLEKAARKAFKINIASPEASRMMALYTGVRGDVGRAFQMLDDQQVRIPKDDPITLEVRGFLTMLRGLRNQNTLAMLPDLREGMEYARKRAATVLSEAKVANPEDKKDFAGQMTLGDAFWNAVKFEPAFAAYERAFSLANSGKQKRVSAQRMGIALMRLGRLKEAENLLVRLNSGNEATATSRAVLAALLFRTHRYLEARDMLQEGIRQKNAAALTVGLFTELNLKAQAQAYKMARDLVNLLDIPETQYAAQAACADAGDREGARNSFLVAATNMPLYAPVLIERAFEIMAYEKSEDRFIEGLNLLDVVLASEPDNSTAVAGRVVALLQQKRFNGAQAALKQLGKMEPTDGDTLILQAADLARDRDNRNALVIKQNLARATAIDPLNYKFKFAPPMEEYIYCLIRVRRTIPLTPNLLDRADAPVQTAKE